MAVFSIQISWAHPALAALAIVAVVPVLTAWRMRRRGRHVGAASVMLQSAAILLAALALAQPQVTISSPNTPHWLLLQDVSASVRGQTPPKIDWPTDAVVDQAAFADTLLAPGQAPAGQTTNAGAPLHLALGSPSLAGVVMVSDGQFHDEWAAAASALGQRGAAVLVVPMADPPADARVAALQAARRGGGVVDLAVTVAAGTAQKRTLVVRRVAPAAILMEQPLETLAGESTTLHVTDTAAPAAEAVQYRAELSPADSFTENDSATTSVLPAESRLAVVDCAGDLPPTMWDALGRTAEKVDPAEAPRSAAGWDPFAAVVVNGPSGPRLGAEQRAALAQYVRLGGGLVLLGAGPQDPPGGPQDAINRVAALAPNLYQRRPLSVRLVLDASGSMAERAAGDSGQVKFDLAAAAVLAMQNHLTDRDDLAVFAFSDTCRQVYASDGKIDFVALREALRGVHPSGPTHVSPALEAASARPAAQGAEGLVIVVSDLLAAPFDPEAMAKRFTAARLALAVVAIESPAEAPQAAPLESLARRLSAPLVRRDSMQGLAEIFAGFVRRSRGEEIRRGRFAPAVQRPTDTPGVDHLPSVDAYSPCAALPGANVLATVEGDPLIASRSVGLGRSVSWALPVTGADNVAWSQSADTLGLLAGAAAWVRRATDAAGFAGEIIWRDGQPVVVIEVAGDAPESLSLAARVAEADAPPAGTAEPLPLHRVAPRRYEAPLPRTSGAAAVVVADNAGRRVWRGEIGGIAPPEFRDIGPDYRNLRRLAELTGGRIIAAGDVAGFVQQQQARAAVPLWPWLLMLALAAMLVEWSLTRVWRRA